VCVNGLLVAACLCDWLCVCLCNWLAVRLAAWLCVAVKPILSQQFLYEDSEAYIRPGIAI